MGNARFNKLLFKRAFPIFLAMQRNEGSSKYLHSTVNKERNQKYP